MPYKLGLGEPVVEGLRRIAIEQIDGALKELSRFDRTPVEAVHKFRRRCKKIRALIRLFRAELEADGTFRRENDALRDMAQSLGHIRDADVMIKTYDKLMSAYEDEVRRSSFAPIRKALTIERRQLGSYLNEDLPALVDHSRREMQSLRQRVETWTFTANGFKAVRGGLYKTYARGWRRCREAMAHPTAEVLHEWRKRVKYHRNHLRLISEIWPALMEPRSVEAEVLGELLGDDHDLAILRDKVVRNHDRFGAIRARRDFIALIDRRRDEIYGEIVTLGARLFATRPAQLIRSLRKWWKIWEKSAMRRLPAPEQKPHDKAPLRFPQRTAPDRRAQPPGPQWRFPARVRAR